MSAARLRFRRRPGVRLGGLGATARCSWLLACRDRRVRVSESHHHEGAKLIAVGGVDCVGSVLISSSFSAQDDDAHELWRAVDEGDVDALKALLSRLGPNCPLVNELLQHGTPALHWACRRGKIDVVVTLLDFGADVTVRDARREKVEGATYSWTFDGSTALHWASFFGFSEIVDVLVDRGSDVGAADKVSFGSSGLVQHSAASREKLSALSPAKVARARSAVPSEITLLLVRTGRRHSPHGGGVQREPARV